MSASAFISHLATREPKIERGQGLSGEEMRPDQSQGASNEVKSFYWLARARASRVVLVPKLAARLLEDADTVAIKLSLASANRNCPLRNLLAGDGPIVWRSFHKSNKADA